MRVKKDDGMFDFNEKSKIFEEKVGATVSDMYTDYYDRLVKFVDNITKDTPSAEDIACDSFIQAVNKIDQYDNTKSKFTTWLFIIARNRAIQEMKKNMVNISMDDDIDDSGNTIKKFIRDTSDDDKGYYDMIEKKAAVVLEAIKELKQPYRDILEMREIQHLSYADISEKTGRNLSTVKSQIRCGRQLIVKNTQAKFALIEDEYLD